MYCFVLNEHTPLISRALTAQLMFSHMQTIKQTDYLMMWLIAFLILVLTPFNEFYDGPINRHAWPDLKLVVGLRLLNKLTRICCDYNDFKNDLFAMKFT